MIAAIERQDSALLLILAGYPEEGRAQFTRNLPDFMQWLGREKDNITIEGEAELAQGIETGYLSYIDASQPLLSEAKVGREQAGRYYHDSVLPLFLRVRQTCEDLRELNQTTMYDSSERARQVAGRATVSLLATGTAVILLGLFFSFFLSNLIVRPLARVIEGIRAIEKGDFDVQVASDFRGRAGPAGQRLQQHGQAAAALPRAEHRRDHGGEEEDRNHHPDDRRRNRGCRSGSPGHRPQPQGRGNPGGQGGRFPGGAFPGAAGTTRRCSASSRRCWPRARAPPAGRGGKHPDDPERGGPAALPVPHLPDPAQARQDPGGRAAAARRHPAEGARTS